MDREQISEFTGRRWLWEELAEAAGHDARELARLCGVSSRQLQREFRRRLGRPPQEWLNERRILAAQRLLLSGEPIKKVAFDLGFKQVSHFCRHFKLFSGWTPSEYVFRHKDPWLCRSRITNVAAG